MKMAFGVFFSCVLPFLCTFVGPHSFSEPILTDVMKGVKSDFCVKMKPMHYEVNSPTDTSFQETGLRVKCIYLSSC